MRLPLWEWGVDREERSSPVGVSMTRAGARAALSAALLAAGKPGRGCVAPVVLIGSAHSDPHYLRLPVTQTAVYDRGTIQWI